jgi:hypothetical protein
LVAERLGSPDVDEEIVSRAAEEAADIVESAATLTASSV